MVCIMVCICVYNTKCVCLFFIVYVGSVFAYAPLFSDADTTNKLKGARNSLSTVYVSVFITYKYTTVMIMDDMASHTSNIGTRRHTHTRNVMQESQAWTKKKI
ncbi:hypothetical protein EON63_21800 [archaeon]|nr:MAG: hypothetical protein EON63_21800 [archaeon]